MVGQGVLRECLLDPEVESILSIGRSGSGERHEKVQDIVLKDLGNLAPVEYALRGYQACLFCLGVSSRGMKEAEYRRVTYDLTLGAAKTLARLNPAMTFEYISGAGTNSTERGGSMWARVKGETENALLKLPFKAAYMFRPGFVQPLHGIQSKTPLYQKIYSLLGPLSAILPKYFPKYATTTEQLGRAMIKVAKQGASKPILESKDINFL